MTCIVGLVDGGKVWMGGDSAGVAGYELTVRADPKVFRKRDMLFGITGSFRAGALLRYKLNLRPASEPKSPFLRNIECPYGGETEWLNTVFMDAWRQCMADGGCRKKESEVESEAFGFLLGWRGKIYNIQGDFQVGEAVAPFDACGCGSSYANGSLFTSTGPPKTRVLTALKAAEAMSAGVRGPFKILSMKAATND